ncbi:hypothetical protein ACWGOQ_0008515 [Aquimarina sp. M1]
MRISILRKFIVPLCLLINCVLYQVIGQNDTIWLTKSNKVTDDVKKDSIYRLPATKKGNLYVLNYYHKDGTPYLSGTASKIDKVVWNGTVKWFTKDGNVSQSMDYENNILHGNVVTFYKNQKLKAIYENGVPIAGSANFNQIYPKQFIERKDSIIREVTYEKDVKGIRYETIFIVHGNSLKKKEIRYYGNDGEYIGVSTDEIDLSGHKGIEVKYFKNPLRVRRIKKTDDTGIRILASYYKNGQIRERLTDGLPQKIQYFGPDGKALGTVEVKGYNSYGCRYKNGKQIMFYSNEKPEQMHLIGAITEYDKEGNIIYTKYFHENQQVEFETIHENSFVAESYNYDQNGREIAKMIYNNGLPDQGVLIEGNTLLSYDKGNIIQKLTYYPATTLVFRVFKDAKATYFDKKGENIGEISY